jgi:hypothetical protein
MANGGLWARKVQLGRETTAGTAAAASTIWRGEATAIKDNREVTMVNEQVGVRVNTLRSYIPKLSAECSFANTPATYEQLPHILEAAIKTATATQDGAGSGYIYDYEVDNTANNTIKTYTIQTGDNEQARHMFYSFVESFTISGERGGAVTMEATWQGRDVANNAFTTSLTVPVVEELLAGSGLFYIDAVSGSFGGTAKTETLLKWSLSVTTGWKGKYTVGDGRRDFVFHYFDKDAFSVELTMTYEHNTSSVAEIAAFEAQTPRLFRIAIPGSALTTTATYTTKTVLIDVAGKYTAFGELNAEDGNSIVEATVKGGYDPTEAHSLGILVVNQVSALP